MMAARKAKTETLGGGVSETRAKSAMVELKTQSKVASSINHMRQSQNRLHIKCPPSLTKMQIMMDKMVQDVILGVENLLILEPKGQKG